MTGKANTPSLGERIRAGLVVLDGATGTEIQAREVAPAAWDGREGCHEILNLTAPGLIGEIHSAYLSAGCDAVETNTFGASQLVLAEYGLADRTRKINLAGARLARKAAESAGGKPRYVIASVGPGTRLPSLGQVSFAELRLSYLPQFEGLLEGGVDAVILETCQDPLQIKAALDAFAAAAGGGPRPLLYVSITMEAQGTMLAGTSIGAACAILRPYPIDILGLNCALGPEGMRRHLEYLRDNWAGFLACMPNAGLPELRAGSVFYPLGPEEFARSLGSLARDCGLNLVGGCCGTTPAHLAALAGELEGFSPPARRVDFPDRAASLFSEVELGQDPRPLYIGERGNATGSKSFREALLRDDYDRALEILAAQEDSGAHLLDLSCAYAGRDEIADLSRMTTLAASSCRAPLVIDSTSPQALEAALSAYGGRAVINSVNLEDGEAKARRVIALAGRFGSALICLCISEKGMARTAEDKLAVARRLVELCRRGGISPGSLLVDPLTFTVASGDPEFASSAAETARALKMIKSALPGVRTVIGLSNVSFGLQGEARRALNAVFLDWCLAEGLDACIVNIAALASSAEIPAEARRLARAVLENTEEGALEKYLDWFSGKTAAAAPAPPPADPRERLRDAIVRGRKEGIAEAIRLLAAAVKPKEILDSVMIPAMQEVGRLFNAGRLQLPFVLKSAEAMKAAVDILKPRLGSASDSYRRTLVLATVAGDVHDIGKNLVNIILSNNGVRVIDLGTRVPVEEIIAAARRERPDAVGMSGLLVKSTAVMAGNLQAMAAAGLKVPVLLGGAALTEEFVREHCRNLYPGPVVYCRDAFASLAFLEKGSAPDPAVPAAAAAERKQLFRVDSWPEAPKPPFCGSRVIEDLDWDGLRRSLDRRRLLAVRWKFAPGKLSAAEQEMILREEAEPVLEDLLRRAPDLFRPGAVYGYYPCRRAQDSLLVGTGGEDLVLDFPRQSGGGGCLADFFRSDADTVGFLAVSVAAPGLEDSLGGDRFREYFFIHGLAAELAEVLAQGLRERMLFELLGPARAGRKGELFAFGYPAAPELEMNRRVCALLETERIGLKALESGMLSPDTAIVALLAHHPQARHFQP